VKVDGRQAACTTRAAAAGQVVRTARGDRRPAPLLLQMLFVEGNHFCPSCEKSGDCQLQAAAYDDGHARPAVEEFFPHRPVDASHPTMWLDLNRCILCKLCVRASHEVDGKDVFAIGGHGIGAPARQRASGRLGDSAFADTDAAAHVCPVGAILPKRRGFAVPIGERRFDREIRSRSGPRARRPPDAPRPTRRRPRARRRASKRIATVSLAGCFGCHMSLLDIDERLFPLLERIEFDRSR
jgi:[NiFe] hydrogenase diaphorase moiety small subunit